MTNFDSDDSKAVGRTRRADACQWSQPKRRRNEATAAQNLHAAIDSNHPEAHYRLGNILGKQGRIGDAAACYQRALALEPDHAESWLGLGDVLDQAQRHDDALA